MFQVCAKQICSSVSHWFEIILKIHVNTYAILSFLTERVLMLFFFFFFFFCLQRTPTGYISIFGVSY